MSSAKCYLGSPGSPGSSWPLHALRANFEVDLTGSKLISFAPSWREKRIGAKIVALSWLEKKNVFHEKLFCLKKCFSSNFDDLCSLNYWLKPKYDGTVMKEHFKSFRMFFFRFFIAIIVTELARKKRKTILFCQNGQHFGNSTLFDLEGVDPQSQIFGQKKF